MKTSHGKLLTLLAAILLPLAGFAQVNSGSNGSDGAFNPTANVVINMADHPDGIYHYTSVNIPAGVTVTFIPNAGNKPVVWLVQGNCIVSGVVNLTGAQSNGITGAAGGPGAFRGGNGSTQQGVAPGDGGGPGGGKATTGGYAGNGSFGSLGSCDIARGQNPAGEIYGNTFILPFIGGSGGGGFSSSTGGGGGGGGAILIAASSITVNGAIRASGGNGFATSNTSGGGGGSGGAIRLVANTISGNGTLEATGGIGISGYYFGYLGNYAGKGRIRFDALAHNFSGSTTSDVTTQGFQPIIIPPANQAVSLAIQNVGGVAVAANPTGQLTAPDVIVPANQQNPIPIVVRCTNIPLNTEIIVDVKPANGATVRAVALNTTGTQASSTATVQVNMPRGGGTIQAKAVSGIALAAINGANDKVRSLAETGWTADGERFAKVEVATTLGGTAQVAYITESGKRYAFPAR